MGDGAASDDHAMVFQEQDRLVAQGGGHPLALVTGQGEAAVGVVVGDPAPEPGAVLVDRQQAAVLQTGQRGRVGHVRVQHAAHLWAQAVQSGVDAPGGRVRRLRAPHHGGVVDVEEKEVARRGCGRSASNAG